jgi:hypothetical protein
MFGNKIHKRLFLIAKLTLNKLKLSNLEKEFYEEF